MKRTSASFLLVRDLISTPHCTLLPLHPSSTFSPASSSPQTVSDSYRLLSGALPADWRQGTVDGGLLVPEKVSDVKA
jgi:hypothetical protein